MANCKTFLFLSIKKKEEDEFQVQTCDHGYVLKKVILNISDFWVKAAKTPLL